MAGTRRQNWELSQPTNLKADKRTWMSPNLKPAEPDQVWFSKQEHLSITGITIMKSVLVL